MPSGPKRAASVRVWVARSAGLAILLALGIAILASRRQASPAATSTTSGESTSVSLAAPESPVNVPLNASAEASPSQASQESPATRTGTPSGSAADGTTTASDWDMEIAGDSTIRIRRLRVDVVKAAYLFWGPDWKWSESKFKMSRIVPGRAALSGNVKGLGLEVSGSVTNDPPNVLTYTYVFQAARDLSNVIGGGIEFRFDLGSPTFAQKAADPVLLPENAGWQWPVGQGEFIEVRFPTPLPDVHFEQGNKNTIRAMFVSEKLTRGTHAFRMVVTLPKGARLAESAEERYGPADASGWLRNAMRWNQSPVDLSYLNHKPAGSRGFVHANGDKLVFEDGSEARFWGGNLAAYALFVSNREIEEQSKRIAKLGYNLMRIHHHDSMSWVDPTVIDKKRDDSQHFDEKGMNRLDYWVACLKDQGVYVWIDLHVGRLFKKGDAQSPSGAISGFEEIARHGNEVKGFCYYNGTVQKLMQEFNEEYLSRVNPYTGLAFRDDPAVMGMLITNENDLTHHFGNLMLPDKNNPVHNALFEKSVKAFCAKTGLAYDETWKTWLPGSSKIFLNNQEHLFNRLMLESLRKTGVRIPVATTSSWGWMGILSLPALTDGDIIDVHSYGEPESLGANPRYEQNYLSWIAAAQVCGKPLSVTEWNVPYPTLDRFTTPLYTAAIACLQGWDAMMIYNYSQEPPGEPEKASEWSTFADPALTGVMPAAALAYRQHHVSPARKTYCLKLDRKQTYYENIHARNSATIRTLAEMSRLTIGLPDIPELDWDSQAPPADGVEIITDPGRDFVPSGQDFVESDTGELKRDWRKGIQTINAARTQAAAGWLGGEAIDLTDVHIKTRTRKAVVAVTSMEEKPIRESRRILLTAMARVLSEGGVLPYLSEPVLGTVVIKAPQDLQLFPLGADGSRGAVLPAQYENGAYTVELNEKSGTHWFVLEESQRAR